MPAICHDGACRMMIPFTRVAIQTYFITPCAWEFFGWVCCIWSPPLCSARFLSRPLALSPHPHLQPPLPRWAHAPPTPSSWRRVLRSSQTWRTCSVSWGPLQTAAALSLTTRTCHCARNGSRGSIRASGGGGGSRGHHGRYCSLVLKELSLLFVGNEQ